MRSLLFSLSLLGAVSATSIARADDPRREEAARYMAEGVKLSEQHDEAGALAKYELAYKTYPSPNALYNIAREKQLLGQSLDAIHAFRECRKNPLLDPKAATMADGFIAELEKVTARIDVSAPPGAAVLLDGAGVDASVPIDVAPGSHTVEASLWGKKASQHVDATQGQVTKVTLEIKEGGQPPVGPPKTETHSVAFPPPTGAIILGGVGLVGLGVGIGLGVASSGSASDARNAQAANQCNGANDACHDSNDAAKRDATISVVSYVAGGALLAGGVVWWLVAPRKVTTSVGIVPAIGPRNAGLSFEGRF